MSSAHLAPKVLIHCTSKCNVHAHQVQRTCASERDVCVQILPHLTHLALKVCSASIRCENIYLSIYLSIHLSDLSIFLSFILSIHVSV